MLQQRLNFFRSILISGDMLLAGAAWIAAYYVRFYAPILPVTKGVPDVILYLYLLVPLLIIFAVAMQIMGVYRRPWTSARRPWWVIVRAVTAGVVVAIALTYLWRPYDFSRLVFVHFYFIYIAFVLFFRFVCIAIWRKTHPIGAGTRTLIVGGGELGRRLASAVKRQPMLGLELVGFLTRRADKIGHDLDGLPVLGMYEQIQEVISRYKISMVILALPINAQQRVPDILAMVSEEMVDIKLVPDLYRYISLHGSVELFDGMPIIGIRDRPMEGWDRVIKRCMDIAGSFLGIMLLSPLFMIISILVKISSPGPVLFRQKRMGLDGRLFTMLKFRTMRSDAEAKTGPVWAVPGDPRRTRLGVFLRHYSLDELPQLFNVLEGQMSLVGPRPERPEFIADFRTKIPGYMLRHMVKAGMTGWAQVNGWRGNTSLKKRLEHDLYYIKNWSPRFDLKIILLTVVRSIVDPNAY